MARVVVAPSADVDLADLIAFLGLPGDTRAGVKARIKLLVTLPERGAPLTGRWDGFRFILGPRRWMLIVYEYDEAADQVSVVTIQDARCGTSASG